MGRAVKVRASALTSDPYSPRNLAMPDFNGATRLAAKQAYEMAGLGPEDVDLVELHDCFATAEIVHYENLGLCGEGEAGRLIDDGETAHGGRIPVNVSGGLLSKGHPLGATGIANIYEHHPPARRGRQAPGGGSPHRPYPRGRHGLGLCRPRARKGLVAPRWGNWPLAAWASVLGAVVSVVLTLDRAPGTAGRAVPRGGWACTSTTVGL